MGVYIKNLEFSSTIDVVDLEFMLVQIHASG